MKLNLIWIASIVLYNAINFDHVLASTNSQNQNNPNMDTIIRMIQTSKVDHGHFLPQGSQLVDLAEGIKTCTKSAVYYANLCQKDGFKIKNNLEVLNKQIKRVSDLKNQVSNILNNLKKNPSPSELNASWNYRHNSFEGIKQTSCLDLDSGTFFTSEGGSYILPNPESIHDTLQTLKKFYKGHSSIEEICSSFLKIDEELTRFYTDVLSNPEDLRCNSEEGENDVYCLSINPINTLHIDPFMMAKTKILLLFKIPGTRQWDVDQFGYKNRSAESVESLSQSFMENMDKLDDFKPFITENVHDIVQTLKNYYWGFILRFFLAPVSYAKSPIIQKCWESLESLLSDEEKQGLQYEPLSDEAISFFNRDILKNTTKERIFKYLLDTIINGNETELSPYKKNKELFTHLKSGFKKMVSEVAEYMANDFGFFVLQNLFGTILIKRLYNSNQFCFIQHDQDSLLDFPKRSGTLDCRALVHRGVSPEILLNMGGGHNFELFDLIAHDIMESTGLGEILQQLQKDWETIEQCKPVVEKTNKGENYLKSLEHELNELQASKKCLESQQETDKPEISWEETFKLHENIQETFTNTECMLNEFVRQAIDHIGRTVRPKTKQTIFVNSPESVIDILKNSEIIKKKTYFSGTTELQVKMPTPIQVFHLNAEANQVGFTKTDIMKIFLGQDSKFLKTYFPYVTDENIAFQNYQKEFEAFQNVPIMAAKLAQNQQTTKSVKKTHATSTETGFSGGSEDFKYFPIESFIMQNQKGLSKQQKDKNRK